MRINSRSPIIPPISFLNDSYRKLINNGRTYAAFTSEELDLIFEDLGNVKSTILDPMSGYGGLMNYCKARGYSTYGLEINLPSFYWQTLVNPDNSYFFREAICYILQDEKNYPNIALDAVGADGWFSSQGLKLAINLLSYITNVFDKLGFSERDLPLALLMPFVHRFSSATPGDVAHVKAGGTTILVGWHADFKVYLRTLIERRIEKEESGKAHFIVKQGDVRNFNFGRKFNYVITSPPFPNFRDYHKIFAPENYFLDQILISTNQNLVIGSNIVKTRKNSIVATRCAADFINQIQKYRGNKKATSDMKSYYIPYFTNYFADLENACFNIIKHLDKRATCYFSVRNNVSRNEIVPVAQTIEEIFRKHHYKSSYLEKKEVFHYGTKNPNSRGLKAKHSNFIIKLWK